MLFLACDLALYRRLTGYPLDSQGRPVLDPATGKPVNTSIIGSPGPDGEVVRVPSYGIRIPLLKAPQRGVGDLSSLSLDAVRLFGKGFESTAFRQVPVFFDGFSGRSFSDVWPCVIVRSMTGLTYRSSDYTPGDMIRSEDPEAQDVSILDPFSGEVLGTGKSSYLERAAPEPYDLTYVITAYAKNKIDLGFMCEQLHLVLQTGGALEVEHMDGEVHPFDFLPKKIAAVGSDEMPGLEGDRFFAMAYTYVVEAYVDNSLNAFGVFETAKTTQAQTAILSSIYELDNIQGALIEPPIVL